ncbi:hypothetical protein [Sphingomonas flavalba]|uniref:hypothetical protein n=1 Tax=Sphingomonas flavalba TaxID=2559804 RepID=UPI00109DD4DB|nr:hypothetical protein [Sphingomonas flavalba]
MHKFNLALILAGAMTLPAVAQTMEPTPPAETPQATPTPAEPGAQAPTPVPDINHNGIPDDQETPAPTPEPTPTPTPRN